MGRTKPFTLTRVHQGEHTGWYVLFRDPVTGARKTKKSVEVLRKESGDSSTTPIERKEEAEAICRKALENNFKKNADVSLTVGEYLMRFYDWETSEYIKRRITLDPDSISKDYMLTRKNLITNHVLPIIPTTIFLKDIHLSFLEDLQFSLVKFSKLTKTTINMCMQSVIFALKEAQRRGDIPLQIPLSVKTLKATSRIRGIMTDDEIKSYLAYAKTVSNKRVYLSAILSLLTGMRSGELRALAPEQIQQDMIIVDRAYADQAGEKLPKGKKTRIIPCPQFLCDELLAFAHTNPYRLKETLVFWSAKGGGHVSSHYFCEIFHETILKSKLLDKDDLERRNITFHSFRHMANTFLRGSVDEYVLRMTIGHSTEQLSDLYTHLSAKAFKSVELAQKANILPLVTESK